MISTHPPATPAERLLDGPLSVRLPANAAVAVLERIFSADPTLAGISGHRLVAAAETVHQDPTAALEHMRLALATTQSEDHREEPDFYVHVAGRLHEGGSVQLRDCHGVVWTVWSRTETWTGLTGVGPRDWKWITEPHIQMHIDLLSAYRYWPEESKAVDARLRAVGHIVGVLHAALVDGVPVCLQVEDGHCHTQYGAAALRETTAEDRESFWAKMKAIDSLCEMIRECDPVPGVEPEPPASVRRPRPQREEG